MLVASKKLTSSVDAELIKPLDVECIAVITNALNARFLNLIKIKIIYFLVIQT